MKIHRCLCGNKPTVKKDGPIYDFNYRVICNNCGIECPSAGRDEKDAIHSWNSFIRKFVDEDDEY